METDSLRPRATWATLRRTIEDCALVDVPGGALRLDVGDPRRPQAPAYFRFSSWPSTFVIDEDEMLFANGRYGIRQFDLNVTDVVPSSSPQAPLTPP